MVESQPVPEVSSKLSAADRLRLIQTLNALPSAQFEELVFAIQLPQSNSPGDSATRSSHSKALLTWVESPIGPGLPELESLLSKIIATEAKTSEEYLSFAISGKIHSKTTAEVRAIVELLRKKTGDRSIDVAFFREGSINVLLSGSPKGLKKLQELFESGELENIDTQTVEAVHCVDINTTDARKTRFVQLLRLTSNSTIFAILARVRSQTIVNTLNRIINRNSDSAINRDLGRIIARAIDLDRAINYAINLASDRAFQSAQKRAHNIALATVSALATELTSNRDYDNARHASALASNIARNSDINIALVTALISDLTRDQDRAMASAVELAINIIYDLASAINLVSTPDKRIQHQLSLKRADLVNANLRNIDLRQANLTEADLSGADLTGAILIGAILANTVLTGAILTRTVFGENEGLTDTDKLDFQRRGAIFQEPPGLTILSLVPSR